MSEKINLSPTLEELKSISSNELNKIIKAREREDEIRYGYLHPKIKSENLEQRKRRNEKQSLKLTARGKRVIVIGLLGLLSVTSYYSCKAGKAESSSLRQTITTEDNLSEQENLEAELNKEELSPEIYQEFLTNSKFCQRLEQNLPIYKKAALKTGIDWKVIVALHYREAEFDPTRSVVSGEKLGTLNPDRKETYSSLLESAIKGGEIYKENLNFVYQRKYNNEDEETLKKGFLAYNRGGAYLKENLNPDDLPYVMNFFNKNFFNMSWPKIDKSKEPLSGKIDENYGAFTVYKILEKAELEGKI